MNTNTTRDVGALLIYGLLCLSVLIAVALVSPHIPALDARPTLRLMLPALVGLALVPVVARVGRRPEPPEPADELSEEEAWAREVVYGR